MTYKTYLFENRDSGLSPLSQQHFKYSFGLINLRDTKTEMGYPVLTKRIRDWGGVKNAYNAYKNNKDALSTYVRTRHSNALVRWQRPIADQDKAFVEKAWKEVQLELDK